MSKRNKGAATGKKQAPAAQARSGGVMPAIAGVALGVFVAAAAMWIWRNAHAETAASAIAPSPGPGASAPAFAGNHYPSQGHTHLDPTEPDDFVYNSNPPTSGPHKEIFSDQFVSPTALPVYVQVHLLEHGNVLLQYSCTCPDVASALSSIAYSFDSSLIAPNELQPSTEEVQAGEEAGKAVIVAPYTKMKTRIALTAWTRLATLNTVDKAKIDSFINLYLSNESNASQ